jgi:shikimate kinase
MTAFLLIGPSGIGKSTAANIVSAKEEQVSVYDLDEEIEVRIGGKRASDYLPEVGDRGFFDLSRRTIEEISAKEPNNTLIIVVGAGSINYEHAHEWYLKQNLISLTGDPQVIYERGGKEKVPDRTVDEYINTEFNDLRQNLYRNSKHIIDVTKYTPEQVADSILQEIAKYLV